MEERVKQQETHKKHNSASPQFRPSKVQVLRMRTDRGAARVRKCMQPEAARGPAPAPRQWGAAKKWAEAAPDACAQTVGRSQKWAIVAPNACAPTVGIALAEHAVQRNVLSLRSLFVFFDERIGCTWARGRWLASGPECSGFSPCVDTCRVAHQAGDGAKEQRAERTGGSRRDGRGGQSYPYD